MRLKELLRNLPVIKVQGNSDLEINSLTHDSRKVIPGSLFIALKGIKTDGHTYIDDAVSRGAIAVMVNEDFFTAKPNYTSEFIRKAEITFILVKDSRPLLSPLGKAFYQDPASHLKLIGVVGTNGKTTSTFLLKSILESAGMKTGLVGTIHSIVGKKVLPTTNTTPGPLELQELLAQMVEENIEYTVMEVSSHALAQDRIAGLNFIGGIFTNITQDHLDYHHTFNQYFQVKSSFFQDLPKEARAVINFDDPHSAKITAATEARVITYGLSAKAEIRAENIEKNMDNTCFTLSTPDGAIDLRLNLIGEFNIYNALGAAGFGLSLGMDLQSVKRGLEKMTFVPGRFQSLPGDYGFRVIIDYAHTPDGLTNLLRTARELTKNRLITVFGCGGERDRGKRGMMGKISAQFSDFTLVTNDNPRSEAPFSIVKEIEKGFLEDGDVDKYKIVLDRKKAIEEAIFMATQGDIVVIAGKGHEDYQIFADRTIHFDDREVASTALKERFGYNG